MTLTEKYPNAFEDEKGTVWTSKQAAESADWSYGRGDAFLDEVLGWDWAEAEANWKLTQSKAKRKAFWEAHPYLRRFLWFIRRWHGALSLFSRTVWRDWEGRISWSTAWEVSRSIWLDAPTVTKGKR